MTVVQKDLDKLVPERELEEDGEQEQNDGLERAELPRTQELRESRL